MFELGVGSILMIFMVLGICIAFVVTWILKSERTREIYEDEMRRLKRQAESKEREISMLADKLEDSQVTIKELEEAPHPQAAHSEVHGVTEDVVRDMTSHLKELENENKKLSDELAEARESLEEVFQTVYEE